MKQHDPEKLLEQFKKSKKVVSTFVEQFTAKHGRKPHGEDLAAAPEYVRVCIKNCKRIKAHLEKKPSNPSQENEKNHQQQPPKKVWGAHLNRSITDITNRRKTANDQVTKTISYPGALTALVTEELSKSTRKSLSKRRFPSAKTMFFDTIGDDTTQGLIDATETINYSDDPLMRFHPELSMDGLSQHGQGHVIIADEDCHIGNVGGTQPKLVKQQASISSKEASKSINVLTAFSLKPNVEATERKFETSEEIPLSFSGIFSSQKRKIDDLDDDPKDQAKKAKFDQEFFQEEEDMFADENVDDSNIEAEMPESQLLPLQPEEESGEAKNNKRKTSRPQKMNGLVSNNFVKIDLKKKNYVRGNKKMTGQKYKRQEWKRKVHGKFGGKK